MTRRPIVVPADMEIMRAVFVLIDNDVSGVPVIDEDGRLTGILTERDCLKVAISAGYHDEPGGRVADFMQHPVQTVTPDDSLMDIAVRFSESHYRRFPVLDDDRLVGVISRRDVLKALKRGAWFEKN